MYRSGDFVGRHVEPTSEEQIQPNGVDLTLEAVFRPKTAGRLTCSGKTIGDRTEIDPHIDANGATNYHLDPGGYIVRYGEIVRIPAKHIGFIYPRSSVMRMGGMINTAVWDAGYEGKGEGLMQVHHPISIESGARISQLVMARANHSGTYQGTYHGENVERK